MTVWKLSFPFDEHITGSVKPFRHASSAGLDVQTTGNELIFTWQSKLDHTDMHPPCPEMHGGQYEGQCEKACLEGETSCETSMIDIYESLDEYENNPSMRRCKCSTLMLWGLCHCCLPLESADDARAVLQTALRVIGQTEHTQLVHR